MPQVIPTDIYVLYIISNINVNWLFWLIYYIPPILNMHKGYSKNNDYIPTLWNDGGRENTKISNSYLRLNWSNTIKRVTNNDSGKSE